MATVDIYGMGPSAPCRILYMTCTALGVEYNDIAVDLMNGTLLAGRAPPVTVDQVSQPAAVGLGSWGSWSPRPRWKPLACLLRKSLFSPDCRSARTRQNIQGGEHSQVP